MKEVVHTMAELRGGASMIDEEKTHSAIGVPCSVHSKRSKLCSIWGKRCADHLRGGDSGANHRVESKGSEPVISPSLLASDW